MDIAIGTPGSVVRMRDGAVNDVSVPTSTPDRTKMYVDLGPYSYFAAIARVSFDDVVVDYP